MIIGYLLLLLAGICQGSFGIGYKKYHPYSWEGFWGIYSTLCFIIPLLWTILLIPNLFLILGVTWSSQALSLLLPILCGIFWGITAIGFSRSVDSIGVSLVYGLSMGVSCIVGSILPLLLYHTVLSRTSRILFVSGLLLTLCATILITIAGMKRGKAAKQKKKMLTGILLALFSGLGSAAMNIGFLFSDSMLTYAQQITGQVLSAPARSALQWLPVLFGGFLASIVYCSYLLIRNKSWSTLLLPGSISRLGILTVTCMVWFSALAIYGNATILLGQLGNVTGWILFNALALLTSNLWGIGLGEWKAQKKAIRLLLLGNLILLCSFVLFGLLQYYQ